MNAASTIVPASRDNSVGDFANTVQIFGAAIRTEAEVPAETMANLVAIEDEGSTTDGMQH